VSFRYSLVELSPRVSQGGLSEPTYAVMYLELTVEFELAFHENNKILRNLRYGFFFVFYFSIIDLNWQFMCFFKSVER